MASEFEDAIKVEALPTSGVHCFPANKKQIFVRRAITITLAIVFLAVTAFFVFAQVQNWVLACIALVGFFISTLVFSQTFLIEKYRVAIDYNEKKVVLRYRYSLISIPFSSFDAREGEPDKAEALLETTNRSGSRTNYIVLDNVFTDVCFQTSTKDLASREDFDKLKEEAFSIADAYGARNSDKAIKVTYGVKTDKIANSDIVSDEKAIDDIVSTAMTEKTEETKPAEAESKDVPETTEDTKTEDKSDSEN